jgi:tight adherence protein B
VLAGSLAAASEEPPSPSITDVHVHDGRLDAVVTATGAGSGEAVAPGSLRVAFGERAAVRPSVTPVARERRAALIVIDTSGSMAGAGLAAAKSAARAFLQEVPADVLVGLASFADRPRMVVAPTTHRSAVRAALGGLQGAGSTSLYDALDLAVRELGASGNRTVVLLSDGADTASKASRRDAEAGVRGSGVRMAVVGFHTDQTQNRVLAGIAAAGHGAFTQALDPGSLRRAFGSAAQEIAAQVRFTVPVPAGVGGAQRLRVTGTVAGQPFTASIDTVLPAAHDGAPAAPAQARVFTAPARSSSVVWIASAAVFVGVLALALVVAAPQLAPAARRRVRALDGYLGTSTVPEKEEVGRLQGLSARLTRAADAYIGRRRSAAGTGLLLERADLPLQLNEWYVLRGLATPVTAVVLWVLFRDSGARGLLTLAGTVLLAGVLPALVLRLLARRRARQFELQLPDVLTLISSSLSTGFSLAQAIDGITRDASEPAAKEFSRTLAETRIGVDLEDALERTAERMDSENLAWTTMAVRIQRRVGGNLADVMRTTARTLRDRETLRRQVRALSADGRMSASILTVLPILITGYMCVLNRAYMAQLWQRTIGVVLLALAGVLLVAGTFWMRRIVNVKV